MTPNQIATLKVGSKLVDLNGNVLVFVNRLSPIFYELKYLNGDKLSTGSVIAVPSHLEHYRLIK